MPENFDLAVIGGGPGGYVAAIRASQLGFKVALVEKEHLGGVCLNWGCIPTKALLKGAEVAHTLDTMESWGFTADNLSFDIKKLVGYSRAAASKLSGGIEYLLRKNRVTVFIGSATLTGKCKLQVTTENKLIAINAMHVILATGAKPRELPNLTSNREIIWTAREAMTPDALPERLLIVGAGAIGCEFASFYSDLGSQVTLVESLDRILPTEDKEISQLAERAFSKRGIDILTDSLISNIAATNDRAEAEIKSDGEKSKLVADRVILAIGVSGNTENLGLESLNVEVENSFVKTDQWCRTNVVGLYAIGDVAGAPWLAHKASHEAVVCVEHIAGEATAEPINKVQVPGCTYCRPQVASVGLSEQSAKKQGINVRVGRFDLQASGKAIAINEPNGLVKTIFEAETGKLIGAHMIGPEVTEQIQGLVVALGAEMSHEQLAKTIFPHPTVSESIHESVLDSINKAIHK